MIKSRNGGKSAAKTRNRTAIPPLPVCRNASIYFCPCWETFLRSTVTASNSLWRSVCSTHGLLHRLVCQRPPCKQYVYAFAILSGGARCVFLVLVECVNVGRLSSSLKSFHVSASVTPHPSWNHFARKCAPPHAPPPRTRLRHLDAV